LWAAGARSTSGGFGAAPAAHFSPRCAKARESATSLRTFALSAPFRRAKMTSLEVTNYSRVNGALLQAAAPGAFVQLVGRFEGGAAPRFIVTAAVRRAPRCGPLERRS
jgi:hypothetical protein